MWRKNAEYAAKKLVFFFFENTESLDQREMNEPTVNDNISCPPRNLWQTQDSIRCISWVLSWLPLWEFSLLWF